ncbi:MAG: phosphate acyltransferase, partial [Rikenellaceae bacterium]
MIKNLSDIVDAARKCGKKRLAVAYGQDSHTLEAVYNAYKEGIIEPTLYGDKSIIEGLCTEMGMDIDAFQIIDEKSDV